MLGRDDGELAAAIGMVRERMGAPALVDAAATVASYNSVVKLADATGIPLEPETFEKTAEIRAALGIEHDH